MATKTKSRLVILVAASFAIAWGVGCSDGPPIIFAVPDAGGPKDSGGATGMDSSPVEPPPPPPPDDAMTTPDAKIPHKDGGVDGGGADAKTEGGVDSGADASAPDTGAPDASAPDTSAPDAGDGSPPVDAGLLVSNCTLIEFDDHSATSDARKITPWDTTLTKQCITIKAGQSVTWETPSVGHPLVPNGGTLPSPILSDNAAIVAFPNVGIYGFRCNIHTTIMTGAIQVIP